MLTQMINHVLRQAETGDPLNALDESRKPLLQLSVNADGGAVAAVEAVLKYLAQLVFQNCQRFQRRNITVAQADIFAGEEVIKMIALFLFEGIGQRGR